MKHKVIPLERSDTKSTISSFKNYKSVQILRRMCSISSVMIGISIVAITAGCLFCWLVCYLNVLASIQTLHGIIDHIQTDNIHGRLNPFVETPTQSIRTIGQCLKSPQTDDGLIELARTYIASFPTITNVNIAVSPTKHICLDILERGDYEDGSHFDFDRVNVAIHNIVNHTVVNYQLIINGTQLTQPEETPDATELPLWYTTGLSGTTGEWVPVHRFKERLTYLYSLRVKDTFAGEMVVAVGFKTHFLSLYVVQMLAGKGDYVFMTDTDGHVLCTSMDFDTEEALRAKGLPFETPYHGNIVLAHENNFTDIRAAVSTIRKGKGYAHSQGYTTTFKDKRKTIIMSAIPITTESGVNLRLYYCIPESVYYSKVRIGNTISAIVALAINLVTIVTITIIASFITHPLRNIATNMDKISNLNFKFNIGHSLFKEISLILSSMRKMKNGLKSFQRYVPTTVVKSLLEQNEEVDTGVAYAELTLLFTDIADFTTHSETLNPVILVSMLQDYFTLICDAVADTGGIVDKYIGDAVMAIWNAPVELPCYQQAACSAGLESQIGMRFLRDRWRDKGLPELHIRVGIASGRVLIGNVGSHTRINYTAIGDRVNLASRLEGLNKEYSTKILIDHDTYIYVKHKFLCRDVDVVRVKGKTEEIRVYEVLCKMEEASPEMKQICALQAKALDLYLSGNYQDSFQLYDELAGDPENPSARKMLLKVKLIGSLTPKDKSA